MASSTNSPGTLANYATVGTVAWTNPSNAGASDDTYATVPFNYHDGVYDLNVRIVKADGTLGSTNKSTGAYWGIDTDGTYKSFGGASDLWGETWTPADINDADFGVAIAPEDKYVGIVFNYLKATNFGFSIPTGATVNGILAEFERLLVNDGPSGNTELAKVDHIRITVYYTEVSSTIQNVQSITGISTITL